MIFLFQAERYVMNELYNLEQSALEGYSTYNFPKGQNLVTLVNKSS